MTKKFIFYTIVSLLILFLAFTYIFFIKAKYIQCNVAYTRLGPYDFKYVYCPSLGFAIATYDKSCLLQPYNFTFSGHCEPIQVSGRGIHNIDYDFGINYKYSWSKIQPTFIFTCGADKKSISVANNLKSVTFDDELILLEKDSPTLIIFSDTGNKIIYDPISFQKKYGIPLKDTLLHSGMIALTVVPVVAQPVSSDLKSPDSDADSGEIAVVEQVEE